MDEVKNGEYQESNYTRWYCNGELHRVGSPAVVWSNGSTEWFLNGKPHREDGPAKEWKINGTKEWFINGLRHRENGPAVRSPGGVNQWYINAEQLTKAQFKDWANKKRFKYKLEKNLSDKPNTSKIKI